MDQKGISRKTFLIYLLQMPLFAGITKYLYGFKSKQHYLLNKFSVAGFTFYNGTDFINTMKAGETIAMKPNPANPHDKYAIELYYKEQMIGHIPRSDNRHIFRLLEQGLDLVCTIWQVNPEEDTWQMCKVEVELVT